MQPITIPFDGTNIKRQDNKLWDPARKRWVAHTPEEWVRQLWVQYWMMHNIPAARIQIEKGLKVNGLFRRTDLVLFTADYQPILLLECKAPTVTLDQKTFDQAARYNMTLQVPYLLISNGHFTYGATIDHEKQRYAMLQGMPVLQ